jgi:hypothetical protein
MSMWIVPRNIGASKRDQLAALIRGRQDPQCVIQEFCTQSRSGPARTEQPRAPRAAQPRHPGRQRETSPMDDLTKYEIWVVAAVSLAPIPLRMRRAPPHARADLNIRRACQRPANGWAAITAITVSRRVKRVAARRGSGRTAHDLLETSRVFCGKVPSSRSLQREQALDRWRPVRPGVFPPIAPGRPSRLLLISH